VRGFEMLKSWSKVRGFEMLKGGTKCGVLKC
jgi:hypothetical protein